MSDPEHGRGKDDDDPQRIKEQLARDNRDITDLWNESLRKYKLIVGVELTGINDERVLSIGEMVNFGTEQMNKFHKFRHDAKKVDRLRSLLKDNLDYIDEGTKQLVSAATPAFPPAAAIGTAFTLLLTACRQVSADYDVVTAFFEDMNSFLQRTSILQSRLPRYPAYLNCLMDVFTALLEMCGFATRYIELGRFKKWIVNLFNGEDGELADARKKMDNAVSRLQSATEFAILGNTEELQRMNADLKQNQELQVKRMEDQSRLIERVLTRQDSVRNELSDIRKLLLVFNERKAVDLSNEGGMNNSRSNPSSRSRIRSVFADAGDPSCEYNEVKESLVPETCTWIFEEPEWTRWLGQVDEPVEESTRILLVSGSPGIGKSHLAAASFDKLVQRAGQCQDDARSATCVAHFYFRAINGGTSKFYQAINWIAVQIAEQNASLGERISSLMEMDSMEFDPCVWQEIWGSFIQPFFSTTGEASQLQIVLDGLDELKHRQDIREMRDFLKLVQDTPGLRVRVLCTARTAFLPKLEQLRSASTAITVTKSKILPDLRALIWHHLNTNSRLRHMSRHTKQRVSSKLEEVSDGNFAFAPNSACC
ncbi:hypothetical protein BJY01DRAFT_163919 [Aspergillus pseudoustus]|uniref:Fungal STAND N-terminal Goodbye domain-containing protein n=1 Tax=Aspergillus pseudoustus TaxID=1810923 RepID=A0ABR4K6C6_9EURO